MNGLLVFVLLVGLIFLAIYAYPAVTGRSFLPSKWSGRIFTGHDPRIWSCGRTLFGLGLCIIALASIHSPMTVVNVVFVGAGFLLIAAGAFIAVTLPHGVD